MERLGDIIYFFKDVEVHGELRWTTKRLIDP